MATTDPNTARIDMRIALLTLLLLLSSGTVVEAQNEYGRIWWDAECTEWGPTMIAVEVTIGESYGGRVHAIQVKRRTNGECGSTIVLETREFEPLQPGDYAYEFIDPEPVGMYPFGYWVNLLDENGDYLQVSSFFEVGTMYDEVSCGTTVIGHGYIWSRDPFGGAGAPRSDQDSPLLEPCPESCWSGYYVGNDENDPIMEQFLDAGVPVLLVGGIQCTGIYGCYLVATAAYGVDCQGTTPSGIRSWGALKSRY
jgi:hypothetical protein